MRNLTFKSAIYILVGLSAIILFILAYFYKLDLSKIFDFLGLIPKVVSIDLLFIAIFVKWGWKLTFFRGWLVPFPNLNGTWVGYIHSDWKNPSTGEKVPPIAVMLTIKQSFLNINCMMRTSEMESSSYSEGFLIDSERQIKNLSYSYSSKPRLSLTKRSIPHDGTVVLKIIEIPSKKLVGRYWTERSTKGEISLKYHSKNLLEELPEDLIEHPVTEDENRH
ncbi:TPA: hypothetical protein ACS7XF_000332 [Providencia alcalifaciens]